MVPIRFILGRRDGLLEQKALRAGRCLGVDEIVFAQFEQAVLGLIAVRDRCEGLDEGEAHE